MAIIGNNADTFLNGLSDFWHRFFKDIGDIQAVYEGTSIVFGQVYLNLLNDVLNVSLNDTPLFRKEYYKLITIREDELVFRDLGTGSNNRYVYIANESFAGLAQLQDTVFSPSASLEQNTDYDISGAEIRFVVDPTDPPIDGFAYRQLDVAVGGFFSASTISDWTVVDVQKGDTLYLNPTQDLGTGADVPANSLTFTVVQVAADKLALSVNTPTPTYPANTTPAGYSWRIARTLVNGLAKTGLLRESTFTGQLDSTSTLTVNQVSFWAVDALVDDFRLYTTFGYLFSQDKQASTEVYRAFIRGLMQLYVYGPAIDRIESALNVTANLPVVSTDGEILQDYDTGILSSGADGQLTGDVFTSVTAVFNTGSVGGFVVIADAENAANIGTFQITGFIDATHVMVSHVFPFVTESSLSWQYTKFNVQTVTTDKSSYTYPLSTPIRADVKNAANYGSLTFKAFETLTTAIQVTDYIKNPEWWFSITVPQNILPDWSIDRRTVSTSLLPLTVGTGFIGDPGFFIGADEFGDATVAVPHRHNAAYILMDRFLKFHLFAVIIDRSVDLSGVLITNLQNILQELKPAHTAIYFQPFTTFVDSIALSETFASQPFLRLNDLMPVIDNTLRADGSWHVGDGWKFTGTTGGAITTGSGAGFIQYVLGGSNPNILAPNPGPAMTDGTLYAYGH